MTSRTTNKFSPEVRERGFETLRMSPVASRGWAEGLSLGHFQARMRNVNLEAAGGSVGTVMN